MSVPAQSILAGLNERQTQAVTALEGPVLIVAGPGSGKTTVLTRMLAALLDAGVPAHRILAVTFTNKAANLMRERLLDLVPVGAERVRVSTFHSACVRILRAHHEHAGLPSSFSIADKSASAGVMRAAASKARLLEGLGKQEVTDMIKMLTSGVSAAKNAGMTPEQLAHHSGDSALIAAAWSGYDAALRAADTVDFDDLLVLATRLTREHSPVRESITRRYDYILVDEYQDTNLIQE
jgi:DNA helicase-2/ATP-dependent DNA helicase PcrA